METKYFFAKVKAINEQARTIEAVASTSDLDRDKDIILPSAFKESIASFKANPVILATHQHRLSTGSSPVIGSAQPESIAVTEAEVLFTMSFASTVLGEEYWQLYRDKHMRAFSIGFIPIEWEDKKDEKLGYVRTYTKIELLEISAVPVPANPNALARAKGFYENDDIKNIVTEIIRASLEEKHKQFLGDLTSCIDDMVDEIKSLLIADPDGLAKKLLGAPSDPSVPAGKNDTAEQSFERIENALHVGDKNNVD